MPRRAYTLLELMLVLALITAIAGMSWPALMRPWSRSLAQQAAQDFASQVADARLRAIEECRTYRVQWKPGTGEYEIASPAGEAEFSAEQSDATRSAIPDDPAGLRDPDAVDANALDAAASEGQYGGDESASGSAGRRSVASRGLPGGEVGGDSLSREPLRLPTRAPWRVNASLLHGVVFLDPKQLLDSTDSLKAADDAELDENRQLSETAAREANNSGDANSQLTDGDDPSADKILQSWAPPVWLFPDGRTSNRHITLLAEDKRQIDLDLRGLTGTLRVGHVRNPRPIMEDETGREMSPQ